jgi:superoxide dismutase, Cu-Zn family
MMKMFILLAVTTSLFLIGGCSSFQKGKKAQEKSMAAANLMSPSGKKVQGQIFFRETDKGIKVIAEVKGLVPKSVHGFHIHEHGKCEGPDYKSAGGHLNPDGHNHSSPAGETKHAGDLGNLVANDKGIARKELLLDKDHVADMKIIMKKAVILHEKADDLVSQPTGDAGGRIGCGIIQTTNSAPRHLKGTL